MKAASGRHGPMVFFAVVCLLVPVPAANSTADPKFAELGVVLPKMECDQLKFRSQELSTRAGVPTQISAAKVIEEVPAPYCLVKGYVSPKVDFEVRLPTTRWTQRFLQTGCGALCGVLTIRVPNLQNQPNRLIQSGEFALAATNNGHDTDNYFDGVWAAEDPQLRIDFAYRGVHVTALAAKALTEVYYGQKPKYSYFMGTSEGGREAAMESQRYPEDFNGITSGAPAINFLTQNTFYHAWNVLTNSDEHGRSIITPDKLPILHAGALAACDEKDGLKDRLISDPLGCDFNPVEVQCKAGQEEKTCLTAAQVRAAAEIYRGAHDERGNRFVISGPLPGSELQWGEYVPADGEMMRTQSFHLATTVVKYFASTEILPVQFTIKDFQFDKATFDTFWAAHTLYDALNPDLSRFASAGGKIIYWHGWADGSIAPTNTIAYYNAVQKTVGAEKAKSFIQLYLFPGGFHSNGGETPIVSDLLTPLMGWVERGIVPEKLLSTYYSGPIIGSFPGAFNGAPKNSHPVRTRPVFPYPQMARYTGSGSPDEAQNFEPDTPKKYQRFKTDWVGADRFFSPNYERWCASSGMTFNCGKQRR